jgi:phosphoribosylaminoimidazolecarboxamide formyltransferase/IMP cyclohydrolase
MSAQPVEMKLIIRRSDGSTEEAKYSLKPIRSGDNPHQPGFIGEPEGIPSYREVIPGRGMGFTNHLDLAGYSVAMEISGTMRLLKDPRTEAVVVNKHTNPAVFAARKSQTEALTAALSTDKKSPFGGVAAFSSSLKAETAQFLAGKNRDERFVLDVLAAPGFEEGSIETLSSCMKNLRIIDVSPLDSWDKINCAAFGYNLKFTIGGKPVITGADSTAFFNSRYGIEVLSKRKPTLQENTDAHIAWIGAKAIQSNSFAFVKDAVLLAQCGGQTNREDSAKFAKARADEFGVSLDGSVAATDSFLFDYTSIDLLHGMGVSAVVHPTRKGLTTGNLKPDQEILARVDEHGMAMLRPYLLGNDGQEMPWRVFRHL